MSTGDILVVEDLNGILGSLTFEREPDSPEVEREARKCPYREQTEHKYAICQIISEQLGWNHGVDIGTCIRCRAESASHDPATNRRLRSIVCGAAWTRAVEHPVRNGATADIKYIRKAVQVLKEYAGDDKAVLGIDTAHHYGLLNTEEAADLVMECGLESAALGG